MEKDTAMTMAQLLKKFGDAGLEVGGYYPEGGGTEKAARAAARSVQFAVLDQSRIDVHGLPRALAAHVPISVEAAAAHAAANANYRGLEVLRDTPLSETTTPEEVLALLDDTEPGAFGKQKSATTRAIVEAYTDTYRSLLDELLILGMHPGAATPGSGTRRDTASVIDALALAGVTDMDQVLELARASHHRPHLLASLALASSDVTGVLAAVSEWPARLKAGEPIDDLLASLGDRKDVILAVYGTHEDELRSYADAGRYDHDGDYAYRQSTGDRHVGSVESCLDRKHVRAAIAAAGWQEPGYEALLANVTELVRERLLSEDIFTAMEAGAEGMDARLASATRIPVMDLDPALHYDWVPREMERVLEEGGGSYARRSGVGDMLEEDNDASPRYADYAGLRSEAIWATRAREADTNLAMLEEWEPELKTWAVKVRTRPVGQSPAGVHAARGRA